MRQLLQSLKSGTIEVAELPIPLQHRGQLLIETRSTLVSTGTEKMLVEFGRAGWIEKARQQPDKFRLVLDKIKTDGLKPTLDVIFNKLEQPLPMGYCNVGKVVSVGEGCAGFSIGDRVISNGKHAEIVSVPINLCAKIPHTVSDDDAAFTVTGAIALQGIRLVQPTLGEFVVVTGLGLIGLLTVQLLRANGCKVLGIDFDKEKLELARLYGAHVIDLSARQDPIEAAYRYTNGRGADAVIITAATKSSQPMHQAALMCRKRGRIVLVGVTGLELSREDFFKKELTFQVSASYGPGRYDPNYEEKGQDYPVGYVRWTQQRNFEAILDMIADGKLDMKPLISHRYDIAEADKAYELLTKSVPALGILIKYPGCSVLSEAKTVMLKADCEHKQLTVGNSNEDVSVSFVGSGNYAIGVLIPAFKRAGANLRSVASSSGVSGLHAARKFGFHETTTNAHNLFTDPETNAVIVTTKHDTHAGYVLQAIKEKKHVFVEKPLCLTLDELREIEDAYCKLNNESNLILMVGFNRRFAPQIQKIKQLLQSVAGPKSFVMTVNAGAIPSDHWTQDPEVGGGRIIGEACHFIDLLLFLAGSPVLDWNRKAMDTKIKDTTSITLRFEDGSIGTIHYFANGAKSFPKERLEIFTEGRVLQLDNFRKLTGFGWPGFKKMNLWRQDKGQNFCVNAFINAVKGKCLEPIPKHQIFEVSRLSIEIATNE